MRRSWRHARRRWLLRLAFAHAPTSPLLLQPGQPFLANEAGLLHSASLTHVAFLPAGYRSRRTWRRRTAPGWSAPACRVSGPPCSCPVAAPHLHAAVPPPRSCSASAPNTCITFCAGCNLAALVLLLLSCLQMPASPHPCHAICCRRTLHPNAAGSARAGRSGRPPPHAQPLSLPGAGRLPADAVSWACPAVAFGRTHVASLSLVSVCGKLFLGAPAQHATAASRSTS